MKERPQMRMTPSLGVFFIAPLPTWLEALARLLGFPIAQPIPVREVSPSETSPLFQPRPVRDCR